MTLPLRSILAAALTAAASYPAAAVEVGHIESFTPGYGATPEIAPASKPVGDPVDEHEWLETSSSRGLHVRLADGAQLTIGTDSRLGVDAFVYDPTGGGSAAARAAISLPIGVVRYVSGGMPNGATTIETPTATLMLRTTSVAIAVNQTGETLLVVDDGEVAVRAKATGNQVVIGGGDIFDVKASAAANRIQPGSGNSPDAQLETAATSAGDRTSAKHDDNKQRRDGDHGNTGESSTSGSSNGGGKQNASAGGGAGRGSGGSPSGAGAGRDGPPKPGGAGAGRDGPPKSGGAGAGRDGPPKSGGAGAGRDGPPKSGGAGAGR